MPTPIVGWRKKADVAGQNAEAKDYKDAALGAAMALLLRILRRGRTSLTLYPGMSVNENSFINLKNASHTITADVDIPEGGANGVLLDQGAASSAAGASI